MKIVKEFILREIAGENVLIPIGNTTQEFNGLITINKTAAFIWKNIDKANSIEEITNLVINKYEIDEESASRDIQEFISILDKANIIEV